MLNSLVAAVVLGASLSFPMSSGDCTPDLAGAGLCSVSNSGSQIDIGASDTRPANPGSAPNAGGGDGSTAPEATETADYECESPLCRPLYEVVGLPEVTIDDLASFRPAAPSLTGEPAGFGVVGMPTNIVAAASEQLIPGNILGWDVVVRFRPAAYVFSYGDGSTQRSLTGGASWPALGQAQFTPTTTSHVYRERGTYPVSVTVQYSAAVDFGGGWRPVAGFVSATAGGYDVQVVEVKTALVDRTCVEDPTGPGC